MEATGSVFALVFVSVFEFLLLVPLGFDVFEFLELHPEYTPIKMKEIINSSVIFPIEIPI